MYFRFKCKQQKILSFFQIDSLKKKFECSRYFCFLPMPETIELSGLPFHINGSFGLRDDRRDFKWMSNDTQNDQSAQWNKLMVDEVLNKVLVQMLNYAKSLIELKDGDLSMVEFYYLLPDPVNICRNWREQHLSEFLKDLANFDLVYSRANKWTNIKEIYLTNKLDEQLKQYELDNCLTNEDMTRINDTIYDKCFDPNQLATSQLPDHLLQIYEQKLKEVTLKYITCEIVFQKLFGLDVRSLDDSKKTDIFNFLIYSVDDITKLSGLFLPLSNSTWTLLEQSKDSKV
jgi:hypothetical protein